MAGQDLNPAPPQPNYRPGLAGLRSAAKAQKP